MKKYNIHPYSLFTDGELFSRLDLVLKQLEKISVQSLNCQNIDEVKALRCKWFEKRAEMDVYIEALEELGHDCSGLYTQVIKKLHLCSFFFESRN